MKTVVRVGSYSQLLTHVRSLLGPWGVSVEKIDIQKYVYDERIEWDNYIVTVPGYGVVGFTDGPE